MGEGISINNIYPTILLKVRCHHFSEPVLHNSNDIAVFMTSGEASFHDLVLLISCYIYCTNISALPESGNFLLNSGGERGETGGFD